MGTAFILGPVFFTLLRNSLQKGVKDGLITALGIVVSDIAVAGICYYFAGSFLGQYVELPIVKFIAAAILISFGVSFIRKPINEISGNPIQATRGRFTSFAQGFIVNFANPAVFLLWIAFITLAKSTYSSPADISIYLIGILLGVFITDAGKALGAARLAPYLKSSWLKKIFKVLGVGLLGVASYLIYQGIVQFV